MSEDTETVELSEKEARKEARKTLAFEIGNLPRLSEPTRRETDYVFRLLLRLPRIIFDQQESKPLNVDFMSPTQVGTICVDGETGEVKRTHLDRIKSRIKLLEEDIDEAVQKALVLSSANRFSRLPFPTHRYTPVLDILSHLLVEGSIDPEEIEELDRTAEESDEEDSSNYRDYIDQLEKVDLVYTTDGRVKKGNVLIEIQAQTENEENEDDNSGLPGQLNAALAHFLERGVDDMQIIRQILGPYLVLSGYYYRRALEIGSSEPPAISEEEFKRELERHYDGEGTEKKFKLSRYLVQLEEVGILQSARTSEGVTWEGYRSIQDSMGDQQDLLNAIPGALA